MARVVWPARGLHPAILPRRVPQGTDGRPTNDIPGCKAARRTLPLREAASASDMYKQLGKQMSILYISKNPSSIISTKTTMVDVVMNNVKRYAQTNNRQSIDNSPIIPDIQKLLKSSDKQMVATFYSELVALVDNRDTGKFVEELIDVLKRKCSNFSNTCLYDAAANYLRNTFSNHPEAIPHKQIVSYAINSDLLQYSEQLQLSNILNRNSHDRLIVNNRPQTFYHNNTEENDGHDQSLFSRNSFQTNSMIILKSYDQFDEVGILEYLHNTYDENGELQKLDERCVKFLSDLVSNQDTAIRQNVHKALVRFMNDPSCEKKGQRIVSKLIDVRCGISLSILYECAADLLRNQIKSGNDVDPTWTVAQYASQSEPEKNRDIISFASKISQQYEQEDDRNVKNMIKALKKPVEEDLSITNVMIQGEEEIELKSLRIYDEKQDQGWLDQEPIESTLEDLAVERQIELMIVYRFSGQSFRPQRELLFKDEQILKVWGECKNLDMNNLDTLDIHNKIVFYLNEMYYGGKISNKLIGFLIFIFHCQEESGNLHLNAYKALAILLANKKYESLIENTIESVSSYKSFFDKESFSEISAWILKLIHEGEIIGSPTLSLCNRAIRIRAPQKKETIEIAKLYYGNQLEIKEEIKRIDKKVNQEKKEQESKDWVNLKEGGD